MTPEQPELNDVFREGALRGRTPIDYIQDEVRKEKEWHLKMVREGIFTTSDWTDLHLASLLTNSVRWGIITTQEMEESLPALGFSPEEASKFLEESVPKVKNYVDIQEKITADYYRMLDLSKLTFKMPSASIEGSPKKPQT